MANRYSEFYKGRRKRRNYAIVPLVILLLILGLFIVLFYSMQKYALISYDGISVNLPLLTGMSGSSSASTGAKTDKGEFEQVNVELKLDPIDYSNVPATAGNKVKPLRAIFVPYEDVSLDGITPYFNRLSSGNALVLDLKQRNGYLKWYSDASVAYSYGLNMAAPEAQQELINIVNYLKDNKIYLVAQICACADDLLGGHSTEVCLRNAYGSYYYDENGYWLDPYSTIVRDYTVQLVRELWDMGFDEVVLADVRHPDAPDLENPDGTFSPQIAYTREMTTTPTPEGAVSGFVVNVAQQLEDRPDGKFLSAYLYSAPALVKTDSATGQNGPLFMKVFDRVFYNTDMYAYTYNLQDITPSCTIGKANDRLIPVVINYLPDNTSWVLVDQEES